jgi:hypothetical protein
VTEADRLAGADPDAMMLYLGNRASNRKKLLFSCACCRLVEHLFHDPWNEEGEELSRRAIEVTERYADGEATAEERRSVADAVGMAEGELDQNTESEDPVAPLFACRAALAVASENPLSSAWSQVEYALGAERSDALIVPARRSWPGLEEFQRIQREASRLAQEGREEARPVVATVLRDVFGNPFRSPPRVEPAWLTWQGATIPKLAASAYADRTFDRLFLVADALEDAGCTDAEVLGHLRGPGPHVRGCWVVDLLLAKK